MNQSYTNIDSQNTAQAASANDVSQAELELGCINLMSQLETQIASARGDGRGGHVENASENTDKLLSLLLVFCDDFLVGEKFDRACAAIEKASFASLSHKEVLNTRSWGFAIRNLFGTPACKDASVRGTYDALGESLLAACVTVFREAIAMVGFESEFAEIIEQSAAVFVEEFKSAW